MQIVHTVCMNQEEQTVSFLLQSFALLLSNLCILSVQLDLSAVGKIDKTNLPGFNSLKNAHILPCGDSYIPS